MANLTSLEKSVLEKLFQMGAGYVLNFSDRTMGEFFRDDIGIDIYSPTYNHRSGSKANRMRGFWIVEDDAIVGKSIYKLIEYVETQILIDNLSRKNFSKEIMDAGRRIAARLAGDSNETIENVARAVSIPVGASSITIHADRGSSIVMGNNSGSVVSSVKMVSDELSRLVEWIANSSASADVKKNLIRDIEAISVQLRNPEPSRSIIGELWGVVSNAAALSGAHDLIEKISGLLNGVV